MARDFDEWLGTFVPSIADYGYYVDFHAVYRNAEKLKVELNIMNSLVGSRSIEDDFVNLVQRYPEVLRCVPLLLAKRGQQIPVLDEEHGSLVFDFRKQVLDVELYAKFMRESGLFDLVSRHIISSLFDYVTGVEVGLNSNARKNRGGHLMENRVEQCIKETGVDYRKEMYLSEIEQEYGLDLSSISNRGVTKKRFDFVAAVSGTVYAFETNFYAGDGSKLNETARSYKMISQEAQGIAGFEFVWVTDGSAGWRSARNNLRETFDAMEHLYCLNDLETGALKRLFKK